MYAPVSRIFLRETCPCLRRRRRRTAAGLGGKYPVLLMPDAALLHSRTYGHHAEEAPIPARHLHVRLRSGRACKCQTNGFAASRIGINLYRKGIFEGITLAKSVSCASSDDFGMAFVRTHRVLPPSAGLTASRHLPRGGRHLCADHSTACCRRCKLTMSHWCTT